MSVVKSLCLMFAILSAVDCSVTVDSYCPEPPTIPNGQIVGETKDTYVEDDKLMFQCDFNYTLNGKYGELTCTSGQIWLPSIHCQACWLFTFYSIPTYDINDLKYEGTEETCNEVCDQEDDCISASFYEGFCYRSFLIDDLIGTYKECEKACYDDDTFDPVVNDFAPDTQI
ncbi:hypothetical protein LOTGIDRAFT_164986 [Lottia gigantea]|uniref:Sushi domain-containing protein n=1 Tax=Lottia gigantea TaxID=225164 RepID=V4BLQ2_LOTGI|nr:hypothetical protein LOTGIDRAFT_164986 [Lottia gigantea]ESO89684.1 hypothetical protein LOTGIDRAFT_164986 [Lottia gigantea]